ncbi:hypothetical protein PybrP1_000632 [[Pythium] brassicae (nom. inval.)]|nr:hypothetical protein PybrP1_000632 [[Pythium] brassicae (nom. inval.)]
MSDAGSDVWWMMTDGLGLEWEWCLAHLTNAATKHALGIKPSATSQNKKMTDLPATSASQCGGARRRGDGDAV